MHHWINIHNIHEKTNMKHFAKGSKRHVGEGGRRQAVGRVYFKGCGSGGYDVIKEGIQGGGVGNIG